MDDIHNNKETAEMVGRTMAKVNRVAVLYYISQGLSVEDASSKAIQPGNFLAIASQSLLAGISVIESRMARFSQHIETSIKQVRLWPEGKAKHAVFEMTSLASQIKDALSVLHGCEPEKIRLSNEEACWIGIGFYG